jgi:hypothetical protein
MKRKVLVLTCLVAILCFVGGLFTQAETAPQKCSLPNCDTLHWTACSPAGATTLCADWLSPNCTTYTCRCSGSGHWFCP